MSWVRLDDTRAINRKLMQAGFEARGFDEAAICLVCLHETDGHLSRADAAMLAIGHGCKNWVKLAARLVEVGRWETNGDGWIIHDYLEYNPSRAEWHDLKERRREAGSIGGKRAAAQRQASATAKAAPIATAKPVANSTASAPAKPAAVALAKPQADPTRPDLEPPPLTPPPFPQPSTTNDKTEEDEDPEVGNGQIGKAVALVAMRRLERTTATVNHPTAWLRATERSIYEHTDLDQYTGTVLTVEQLADRIEPKHGSPDDRTQAAQAALHARNDRPRCETCDGTGWIGDPVIRCPDCT